MLRRILMSTSKIDWKGLIPWLLGLLLIAVGLPLAVGLYGEHLKSLRIVRGVVTYSQFGDASFPDLRKVKTAKKLPRKNLPSQYLFLVFKDKREMVFICPGRCVFSQKIQNGKMYKIVRDPETMMLESLSLLVQTKKK